MNLSPEEIERLSMHLDGVLPPGEKSAVEELLASNHDARAWLEKARAVKASLGAGAVPPPPDSFYQAVWRRVDARQARRSFWTRLPARLAGTLAAAALVVVATRDFWRPGDRRDATSAIPSPIQLFQSPLKAQQEIRSVRFNETRDRLEEEGPKRDGQGRKRLEDSAALRKDFPRADDRKEDAPMMKESPAPAARGDLSKSADGEYDEKAVLAAAPPASSGARVPLKESFLDRRSVAKGKAAAPRDADAQADLIGSSSEWAGADSGIAAFTTAVVRTDAEWRALWSSHAPGQPLPPVDFKRLMVVAVFSGEKPTAAHGVRVTRVSDEGGRSVVRYRETPPPPNAFTAQMITTPFHIRAIPRRDGPVDFLAE